MRIEYFIYFGLVHVFLHHAELMARHFSGVPVEYLGVGVFRAFFEKSGLLNLCEEFEDSRNRLIVGPLPEGVPQECLDRWEASESTIQRLFELLPVNPLESFAQVGSILLAVRDFFWISGYPTVMGEGTSMELYFGLTIKFVGIALLVVCFWPILRSLLAGISSRFGV